MDLLDRVNNVNLTRIELRNKNVINKIKEAQTQLEFEDQKSKRIEHNLLHNSNLLEQVSQFSNDTRRVVKGGLHAMLLILCEQFQIEQRKASLREKIVSLNDSMRLLEQTRECLDRKADLIHGRVRMLSRTRRVVSESTSQNELESNYLIGNKVGC